MGPVVIGERLHSASPEEFVSPTVEVVIATIPDVGARAVEQPAGMNMTIVAPKRTIKPVTVDTLAPTGSDIKTPRRAAWRSHGGLLRVSGLSWSYPS